MKNDKGIRYLLIGLVSLFVVACTPAMSSEENDSKDTNNEAVENNAPGNEETTKKDNAGQDEEVNEEPTVDVNIQDDTSITVLVNKYNSLDEQYEPEDLIPVTVPTILENPEVNQLRKEASDALQQMFSAAEQEEIYLFARSGYRSYNTQVQLFQSYSDKHGEEAANRYSAKPGFSEHQTGLVMDITSESVHFQLDEQFGKTTEGIWVANNAYQFGFIIRYPQGKEEITGYIYEPWHLRYVGEDVAAELFERDITYEEFLVEEGIINENTSKK